MAGRSACPLLHDRAWAASRRARRGGSEHLRDLGQASPLAGVVRYPSRMGRLVRLFEGRFGRLLLMELAPGKMLEALADPVIVLQQKDGELLFLNPGEVHVYQEATRALVFHAAGAWLHAGFPAVFGPEDPRPFALLREPVTPRIRRLAEPLAVEVLNDRFLSAERLEFMLQELVLLIVETYLAKRRAAALLDRKSVV